MTEFERIVEDAFQGNTGSMIVLGEMYSKGDRVKLARIIHDTHRV